MSSTSLSKLMGFRNIFKIKGSFNWLNFVKQVIHVHGEEKSVIVPLAKFVERYPDEVTFLSCDKLEQGIETLRNTTSDVQVVAMGGMGKTRLLYEAFKDNTPEHAWYCYHAQGTGFTKDLDAFFQDESHKEGLLVLDNCPNELITYARGQRMSHGSNIRFVFAHHDYFEAQNFPDTLMIDFTSNDMRGVVDEFIQQEIYHQEQDRFICDRIKDMADGYPQMAIILVEAYKKHGQVGVNDVESLMETLIGRHDDNGMKVLECLSLFQPLGYRAPVEKQYNTIMESSILTGMYCSVQERRDIFNRHINHFNRNGELVEVSSSWLNVRPLPLAIWLMGKWLEGHDEQALMQLINDFDQLPGGLAAQLGSQMHRRLRNMEGNAHADFLIGELLSRYENSPFGAEGVLCSELGSRLFLGFAHVNYQATAHCMHGVIAGKSIEELQTSLKGSVRRNIIWTLEKLCYPENTFMEAAECLLRLALAENENYGNNATGQLTQLFHILLPGTGANLQLRSEFLRLSIHQGDECVPIVVKCLDSALSTGSFSKMGGADEFGSKKWKDYTPSVEETMQYWIDCVGLLGEIVEQYPQTLLDVKAIAEERCYGLMMKNGIDAALLLTEIVCDKAGNDWMPMYGHYHDIKKRIYGALSPKNQEAVDYWLERLKPNSISSQLKEIRMKVFESSHKSYIDEEMYAARLLEPLVNRFVTEGIYDNPEELRSIIYDKEYFDFRFSRMLCTGLDDRQLSLLLGHFMEEITKAGENFHSPFFYHFCQNLKEREPFEAFLQELRNSGYHDIYVHLLANVEDERLIVFHRIKEEVSTSALPDGGLNGYLWQVGWMNNAMLLQVLTDESVIQHCSVATRIRFLERFQFGNDVTTDAGLLGVIKDLLLQYEYNEKQPSANVEYSTYLRRLLEKSHDVEFAKAVCHKMIELLNTNYVHSNFDHIFYTLLNNYTDDIWDDFSEKFVAEEYAGFFYQIKDEVGSGYDFGSGPMYQHGDERIMALCKKYPKHAPYCVALTCPVFSYKENEGGEMVREDRFSNILIWVLENYGSQDNTLDGAGGNIGSFGWTGSPIPLFQSQIECMKQLLENKKMHSKVKKWANDHIKHYVEEIKREQNRLDFERMHYQ